MSANSVKCCFLDAYFEIATTWHKTEGKCINKDMRRNNCKRKLQWVANYRNHVIHLKNKNTTNQTAKPQYVFFLKKVVNDCSCFNFPQILKFKADMISKENDNTKQKHDAL